MIRRLVGASPKSTPAALRGVIAGVLGLGQEAPLTSPARPPALAPLPPAPCHHCFRCRIWAVLANYGDGAIRGPVSPVGGSSGLTPSSLAQCAHCRRHSLSESRSPSRPQPPTLSHSLLSASLAAAAAAIWLMLCLIAPANCHRLLRGCQQQVAGRWLQTSQ